MIQFSKFWNVHELLFSVKTNFIKERKGFMCKFRFIIILTLMLACPLMATTYYVAKTGSDSNAGTQAAPWLTIGKAASTMVAGDKVIVVGGASAYVEKVVPVNSGTSGARITYEADNSAGDVIIDGTGKDNCFSCSKSYTTIDGFTAINAGTHGINFSTSSGSYGIIKNCTAYDINGGSGGGIRVDTADYVDIENCLVFDNAGYGILIASNAEPTDVKHCTVYGNGKSGIRCNASDTTIIDTISTSNSEWGVNTYATVAVSIDYSDVWNNTSGSYDNLTKITVGSHCISSNPLFVDAANGDFRLGSGSPCIGTASDSSNMGYIFPAGRPPVADAGPDKNAKRGYSVSIDGSASYDPDGDSLTYYHWSFGDGNTASGAVVNHTYSSVGQYTATLEVSDGTSTDTDTCLITVAQNIAPVANAGADANVMEDRPSYFDGSGSDADGDTLTYSWNFGDGQYGEGAQVYHTYSTPGNYNATLTVSDGFGGSDDDICVRYVGVNSDPVADPGSNRSVYVGDLVIFSAAESYDPDGDPLVYTWDFGDGGTGVGVTKTHVYTTADTYTVTLTADDGWGGVDTASCTVTAIDRPVIVTAFPGAEGAGKWTQGGRGGAVYEVTNLNNSGTGSLREAVQATGPRIVVFRVSGTIALQSHLNINNPYITIAGQTAPGDGICLKDYGLTVSASEVIIRFLRVRTADNGGAGFDTITVGNGTNIIFDHCSASWGVDETLSTTTDNAGLDKVTVQWCLITEGLNCSNHPEGCHGMGTLAKGCYGAQYSYHHNLYAHQNNRSPYPGNYNDISVDPAGLTFDFRNNVIYNWGGNFAGYNTQNGANSVCKMNFVNNYYKQGPDSTDPNAFYERVLASKGYFSGNMMNGSTPSDPWSIVLFDSGWTQQQKDAFKQSQELPILDAIPVESAQTAYSRVLEEAGAILPERDNVDLRIIDDVIDGTGGIIDDEDEVGGWPTLSSDTPPTDTDHDGMPDSWESAHGLNPNNASDGSGDRDSDGYTNIEEYLNSIVGTGLNEAPVVSAGENQSITLPNEAVLNGTVTDDGLPDPPGAVTVTWTKQSGPGTVTFGNANVVDTTAEFSSSGMYALRLTANDGSLSNFAEIMVLVNPASADTTIMHWDGGLGFNITGSTVSNGRWEDASNWFAPENSSRDNTLPILGDTVRIHFMVTQDPPNPNSPNFNPESHITVDTVGVAKAGKVQTKEYTNSLTIEEGADLETRGNIEFYQDWTFNVHDLIVYGTLNACTNVGQVRIGGHQSFSYNNMYVYGVVNILGATGGSELWMGYAVVDSTGSYDHNRLYIYSSGFVITDDLLCKGSDAIIDIQSGGKLVVKGNEESEIDGYVSEGRIIGDGGSSGVTVTYYASSDETVIQVVGIPTVNAGPDQLIVDPVDTVDLDGTVSGGSTQWSKFSGPGTVTFGSATSVDTTATFSAYGTYILCLQSTQSGKTGYDYVTIKYYETAPVTNAAPVVNAGADQSITLPADATLDGTITDDGMPNPPGYVTTLWTKQTGPGIVTFDDSLAVDTTASFSAAGTYVLRLTALDGELMSYDELVVAVTGEGEPNEPPEPNIPPAPPIADWYRVAWHIHSTNSDGAEDPNRMLTNYRNNGTYGKYSAALFTDHDYITDSSVMDTSTFMGINGVEVTYGKSHVNAFGVLEPVGILTNPGSTLQEHIDRALAAGGIPIVNHPLWTIEFDQQKVTNLVDQIINSTGCKYFEIYNYLCDDYYQNGFSETEYDQVLSSGKMMYCVAGDDAHGLGRAGYASVYIGAEELTLDSLKAALEYGYVYCCRSTTKWHAGIKLTAYEVTGNEVGDTISITADANATKIEFIGKNGAILKTVNSNSGSYTIASSDMYVRGRVTNTDGDYTWTQPVFVGTGGGGGGGGEPCNGPIDDYEGYDSTTTGTQTTGGKGGAEIIVTNLNDSGAGSLRDALAQCGTVPHIIKFQVGGVIGLQAELEAKAMTTIAGETAPLPGITLVDTGTAYRALSIDCHDFIIRHIRIRSFGGEGIQIWGGNNNIINRCSFSGMGDGCIDMNTGGRHNVSRCLFGGSEEGHKAHCSYVSFHHNYYGWLNRRMPRIYEGGPNWDFRNNAVQYWTNSATNILNSTGVNLINNYYGPPAPLESWSAAAFCAGQTDPATVYTHGNYCAGYNVDGVGSKSTPNTEPNVTTMCATCDPNALLADIKGDVGAYPNDEIDQYYLNGGGLNPPPPPTPGGGGGGGGGEPNGFWSIIDGDYYVDKATGNDDYAGTLIAPFKTIGKAISVATSAGAKVIVWGNNQTYTEQLEFSASGTANEPITFVVDPGSGIAVIDGGSTTSGTIYSTTSDYIVLDGFTITNGRYGIYLYGEGVDGWTIKNCFITGNDAEGIYIRNGDDHSIFNSIISDNGSANSSIYIYSGALNVDVTQCDVYKGKYGINYSSGCSGDILNSIITNATTNGVKVDSSTVTITYSDVWSNGTNYYGITAGAGCISANPLWTDPVNGDFTLDDSSPCKGAASDGGDMGYRGVEYAPGNQPPVVNVGSDLAVSLPSQATLDATVTDDGMPDPPGSVTTTWTKQSGPGTVTFGNIHAVDTTASFSAAGTYVLRLTANDSALGSYDEITVTVSQGNAAPSVNAGSDQQITLPASASLDGTVTDDGQPNPPAAVTVTWTKTSGPGTVTFGNLHAVDTTASFSTSGTYVLRLTADDSALQAYDELTITVNPGSATFSSLDARDGTLKESTETSGVGGNAYSTYSYIGDTSSKQQYLIVLHFDTSSIPDGATITSATLSMRRTGKAGDPTSLGTITVDIKNGYYGTSESLLAADFEAASSATGVATLPYPAANGDWVEGDLNSSGLSNINKTGVTQFKVRFTTDDDNDGTADYLNIYDGTTSNPTLEVAWQ